MSLKRIICAVLMFVVLSSMVSTAHAASYPIIVEVGLLGNISLIANHLHATTLDNISGTKIYLLSVPDLGLLNGLNLSLLGIVNIEYDKTVPVPQEQSFAVLSVPPSKPANWYASQPALGKIRAPEASAYSKGRGVVIADINSKVDYAHPALQGHLTGGYDFVSVRAGYQSTLNQSSASFLDQSSASFLDQSSASFLDQSSASFLDQSSASFLDTSTAVFLEAGNPAKSHGTLCAGILAAMAPESMIMPIRAFDDSGNADFFSIARAIYYAKNQGAHVINMSFGLSTNSYTISKAITAASNAGIVLVASAGNVNSAAVQYPAGFSAVMSVASTDLMDKKAPFSNYGSKIYVDAPGVNIISAFPGGYYSIVSGTSFSAPMVAAEAALIRSLKTTGIKSAISGSAISIDPVNPSYVGKLGYGRVDVLGGVRR